MIEKLQNELKFQEEHLQDITKKISNQKDHLLENCKYNRKINEKI